MGRYRASGFGHGHRVAILLENRPEHFLHKLALNALGVSCVPINPDYSPAEAAYLLENSSADLAILIPDRLGQLEAAMAESSHKCPLAVVDGSGIDFPGPARAPLGATNVATGTGEARIALMILRIDVSRPPGVFMRSTTAAAPSVLAARSSRAM